MVFFLLSFLFLYVKQGKLIVNRKMHIKKMKFLLNLKPWQLFSLILVPNLIPAFSFWIELLDVIALFVYIGWIYSIGVTMHSLVSDVNKPNLLYFKICCIFISVTYVIELFVSYSFNEFIGYSFNKWMILLVIFVICIMFYVFMFAAQMLESVINGYLVYGSDSLKAFFGFWFFPIGIWYIQPVVQRVLKQNEAHI